MDLKIKNTENPILSKHDSFLSILDHHSHNFLRNLRRVLRAYQCVKKKPSVFSRQTRKSLAMLETFQM